MLEVLNVFVRYVDYICRMVSDEASMPHCHQVMLSSLTMSPVPLANRNRCMSVTDFIVDQMLFIQCINTGAVCAIAKSTLMEIVGAGLYRPARCHCYQ